MLAARILGEAAVLEGRNALQTQAYGAEARGSMTKSEVIISDGRIGFPAVRKSDVLVTMSQEATDALTSDLKDGGLLIVDSTNVRTVPDTKAEVYRLPATAEAKRAFGEGFYANMVMLGALTRISHLVGEEAMERAIAEKLARKRAETNLEAFRLGLKMQPPPT